MSTLKQKLLKKELTFGSWLSFGFIPITEMMSKFGFEWLVIDLEHAAINSATVLNMIQIINLTGISPLVRVGKNDELLIKHAMDSGAEGVIVPMVNTKAEAEHAVKSVKYPPAGTRGVGLSRAQGFGLEFESYKNWVANNSVVIVQIEHIKAVENLSEILSVEGVDGFIIGPYDLSGSVGHPGEFNHPSVEDAMKEIEKYLIISDKPGGIHVVHSNHNLLEETISKGYKFIAYGDDMVFFAEKLNEEKKILMELKTKFGV